MSDTKHDLILISQVLNVPSKSLLALLDDSAPRRHIHTFELNVLAHSLQLSDLVTDISQLQGANRQQSILIQHSLKQKYKEAKASELIISDAEVDSEDRFSIEHLVTPETLLLTQTDLHSEVISSPNVKPKIKNEDWNYASKPFVSKTHRVGIVAWFNGEYGVIKSRFGEAFVHKNSNPLLALNEGDTVQYEEHLDQKKNRNNAKKCQLLNSLNDYADKQECVVTLSYFIFDQFSQTPGSLRQLIILNETLDALLRYRLSLSFQELANKQQDSLTVYIPQWDELIPIIADTITLQLLTSAIAPIVTLFKTIQQRMPHWFLELDHRHYLLEQCFWRPMQYCSGKLSADRFISDGINTNQIVSSLWPHQTVAVPAHYLNELQTNLEQWCRTVLVNDELFERQTRERVRVISVLLKVDPAPFEQLFQFTPTYELKKWLKQPNDFAFPKPKTPDELVNLLQQIPAERLYEALTHLPLEQVKVAYPLLTSFAQAAAVEWFFEKQIHSLGAVTFDIETKLDGTIQQVCFTVSERFEIYRSINETTLPICIGAFQGALDKGKLLVGHNIRDFDIPILAKYGADFGQLPIWDTLEIEALLRPLSHSFALVTAHDARSDTEKTVNLFRNQLQRILLSWAEYDQLIQLVIPIEVYQWLNYFVDTFQNGLTFPSHSDRSLFFHNEPVRSPPIHFTQYSFKEPTLLVVPRITWAQFVRLPNVEFVTISSLKYDFEYEADPYTICFDIDKIRSVLKNQYIQSVLLSYVTSCHRNRVTPTIANLPIWIKLRVLTELSELRAICQSPIKLPEQPDLTVFYITDDISAIQLKQSQEAVWSIEFTNPILSAVTFKHRLGLIRLQDKTDIFNQSGLWTRMVGGNRFTPVPIEWLTEVSGLETPPSKLNNFWLEKDNATEFTVWGNIAHAEVYQKLTIDKEDDETQQTNEQDTCSLTLIYTKEQTGLFYRLNSETPYRDIYWTGQFYLLQQLVAQQPVIWLIQHSHERPHLQALLESMGYWCPPAEHSMIRQMEMLHQSQCRNRVLIAPLRILPNLIQANEGGQLTFIIDSLPLTEVAMMVPQHIKTQINPDELIETNDDQSDDESLDSESDGQPTDTNKSKIKRINLDVTFQLIAPLIQYYRQLIYSNNSSSQLIVTDPRLVDQIGLAKRWSAKKQNIQLWDRDSDYSALYEQVTRYILSPKKVEFNLSDLAKIQQTIERVFLGQNEHGEWLRLRANQQPYFDNIIQPTDDLIVGLPTGSGKSILFQGPALYRGSLTNRLTVVITPLRALMEDQVSKLEELGFFGCVEFINQQSDNVQDIYRRLAGGEITLLYVTPERFRSRNFDRALNMRIKLDQGLEYCVFDEAHCISQWGSEFRPDYLWVATFINRLKKANGNFPALFFSATISEQIYNELTEIFQ